MTGPSSYQRAGGGVVRIPGKTALTACRATVFVLPILQDQRNQSRSFQKQTLESSKHSLLVKSKLGIWE